MSTSAELNGEVACFNNTDYIAVFFAEKRHCAKLFSLCNRHFPGFYIHSLKNNLVYEVFNLCHFLGCHCGKMSEVETENIIADKLSCLLYVCAKHLS